RPLTMNHDGSLIYVNVNNLDGFEIADTKTCQMIKRVELPGELWKEKWADPNKHFFGHGLPSHGIGMTPDESEIWVTDVVNDSWQVWDNPGDGRNPVYNPAKTVKVQQGHPIHTTEKLAYLTFDPSGRMIDASNQFAIGMEDAYKARMQAPQK